MAKIHVIVPVYKVEPYLGRCVSSILGQSFPDFRLVLVDDGSPDGCGRLCDEFAARDSRIHVIHQENGGLSAARNAGLDWAIEQDQAQWLAFVDSDDWVHPEFLERLYDAAQGSGCRISACGFFLTAGEDFTELEAEDIQVMATGEYYCGSFPGTSVAWNKLYHVSLFEHRRYPVGKLHEDEFLTYQCLYQAGQIAVTRMPLYAYFQNQQGITLSQWKPGRLDALEAFEGQIAFARQREDDALLKKCAEQYIFGILDQLKQASPEYGPMLRRKLRRALKLGRETGVFPWKDHLWAYEQAYPGKLLWWLYFRLRGED